jgi:hypothetical protein
MEYFTLQLVKRGLGISHDKLPVVFQIARDNHHEKIGTLLVNCPRTGKPLFK